MSEHEPGPAMSPDALSADAAHRNGFPVGEFVIRGEAIDTDADLSDQVLN